MLLSDYISDELLDEIPGIVIVLSQAYLSKVKGNMRERHEAVSHLTKMISLECFKSMPPKAALSLKEAFNSSYTEVFKNNL